MGRPRGTGTRASASGRCPGSCAARASTARRPTTAVEEIGRDDERARARALVDRRLPSLARFEHAVAARRLVGMLARKGYDAGVAYGVVREALAERPSPDETGDEALDDLLSDPDADHR